MKTKLLLVLMAVSLSANADQLSTYDTDLDQSNTPYRTSFNMGHNLTPTSYTPAKGQLVAGLYSIIYGISDQLMVGTSPWMIAGYNLPMLNIKYSFVPAHVFDHASIEQMYFKTFPYGFNAYEQESTWTRLTGTLDPAEDYSIHFTFGLQYFFNNRAPYSMSPPSNNNTPLTLSLSALQEVRFTEHFGMFFETGFLAFNYPNRYAHLGASTFFKWSGGYVQLGISKTMEIGPELLRYRVDYSDYLEHSHLLDPATGARSSSIYYSWRQPIHPELHIEFLL